MSDTLTLAFGVRRFIAGKSAALHEMRDGHYYFNALVAIERWKRRGYRRIRSRYVPGLGELEGAYELLSDWIGERAVKEAGKKDARSGIKAKRKKASTRNRTKKGAVKPTKQVDVSEEEAKLEFLKQWRRDASEAMRPKTEAFEAMVAEAVFEYAVRSSGAPRKLHEQLRDARLAVKQAKGAEKKLLAAQVKQLGERIKVASLQTHKRSESNARVRAEMLAEPQWHEAWKDIARLEAKADELWDWMQDAHNLNHGTYSQVRDDVDRAGKRPPPRPDGVPRKPKERPAFSSKGLRQMGWQIAARNPTKKNPKRRPYTWGEILAGEHPKVRAANVRDMGAGRKKLAEIHIEVTSGGAAPAEWVVVEVVLHRPIPEDTVVLDVYLVPKSRADGELIWDGGRPVDAKGYDFDVQFTIKVSEPLVKRASGEGTATVHLCWTEVGYTLMIARVNGEPVLLPRGVVRRLRSAERVRGFADQHFDVARETLSATLTRCPQWVQVECEHMGKWRAHGKLARVVCRWTRELSEGIGLAMWRRWRDKRLEARPKLDLHASWEEYDAWAKAHGVDDEMTRFVLWLDCWRRKDLHLKRVEDGTRRRAMRARKDFYRVTAARLAERFDRIVVVGAVDLAALALRDKAEDKPKELHRDARHNRTLAALYELKEALKHAFGKDRYSERSGGDETPGTSRDPENMPKATE